MVLIRFDSFLPLANHLFLYIIMQVRNAVHCTDLESDGASECEYFLKLLDEVAVASTPRSP